jgi:hypothetical protein
MSFFFKQSVTSFRNLNGKKKTVFEIVKGKNGQVDEIKGISSSNNPGVFNIQQKKAKVNSSGMIMAKKRVFKLKASDIKNLLSEEKKSKPLPKKQSSVKKSSPTKSSTKLSTKSIAKTSKTSKKKNSTKKSTKKVDVGVSKKKIPVKKIVRK